jgi:hypothetical protein
MTRPDLWEKYDTCDNEAISKYLYHCTAQRTEAKCWDVRTMYEELQPVIEKFESLLPEHKPVRSTRWKGGWRTHSGWAFYSQHSDN